MSNFRQNKNLSGRPALPAFVALSLCASMLAFGCTTDRNLGNGDPVVTPGLRSSPTGGSSVGSESAPTPPPMMSSAAYSSQPVSESLSVVRARKGTRLTADEAAAIMADNQPRVRVLGPASPDNGGRPYVSDRLLGITQQQSYPQQLTINSSINSANNGIAPAAITSGIGETFGTPSIDPTTGAVTTTPVNTSIAGGAGTTLTPTGATFSAPPGTFASVRTLTPTAAVVLNPPASISGSPAIASTSPTQTSAGTTTATTARTVSPTSAASPVRIVNSDGRITVTNSGSTRQQ
ncbi:MAG TPA: hypothetical protein VEK79_12320 [Thermoanaerobaculia bacterium]|nr:hypothetical protein [Thermoanaerobaculia bacterium]